MREDLRGPRQLKDNIIQSTLILISMTHDLQKQCTTFEELTYLNSNGRKILVELKGLIDSLEVCAKEGADYDLQEEVKSFREQFSSNYALFRKANVSAMLAIQRENNQALFRMTHPNARQRKKKTLSHMAEMSSETTNQLLQISRHLADTTQLSADSLSTLANSSSSVFGTYDELSMTKGAISQSGKLLAKHKRRQFTDKLIILLGFAFFMACVFYVLNKRIW